MMIYNDNDDKNGWIDCKTPINHEDPTGGVSVLGGVPLIFPRTGRWFMPL